MMERDRWTEATEGEWTCLQWSGHSPDLEGVVKSVAALGGRRTLPEDSLGLDFGG
jgi:hypothetical protein